MILYRIRVINTLLLLFLKILKPLVKEFKGNKLKLLKKNVLNQEPVIIKNAFKIRN